MIGLKKAIAAAGGSHKELASLIGVRPNVVWNWVSREKVPADKVLDIERALNGAVTRYELRPDVFGKRAA